MKEMRRLGFYIKTLAKEKNISNEKLCELLDISQSQLEKFFVGRFFLTYKNLELLTKTLNTTTEDLLTNGEEAYQKYYTKNFGEFTNPDSREEILDLIDDYLDVKEMVDDKE